MIEFNRSMKRGIEPKLDPIETENDQRLRHCELHEQLSKFYNFFFLCSKVSVTNCLSSCFVLKTSRNPTGDGFYQPI